MSSSPVNNQVGANLPQQGGDPGLDRVVVEVTQGWVLVAAHVVSSPYIHLPADA